MIIVVFSRHYVKNTYFKYVCLATIKNCKKVLGLKFNVDTTKETIHKIFKSWDKIC